MSINAEIYNGQPSFKLPQRPWLSIIVPCYNSRKTLGALLQSIVDQNMEDEIEVILSDDHSTESYQDIVEMYNDTLSIRQVMTEYNFAPGNTRERGVSIAEGEWVAFADHDDVYIPGTLRQIKDIIVQSGEQYYAIANFIEANPDTGEVIREMKGFRNWNHAKFYNLDNFWKANDIHFKKDLLTHEDIYISSTVNCAIRRVNGDNPLFIDVFCYIWNNRPTSISREKYGDHTFLEVFYEDYIKSTGDVYIEQYKQGRLDNVYATDSVLEILLFCYFYTESFKFHDPNGYIRENDEFSRRYLVAIKQAFGFTNDFIVSYVAQEDAIRYTSVRETAIIGAGPCLESRTFAQWLDYLHEDIKPRITMSDAMHK